MATVRTLGILPFCLQTRPDDSNGVEVSKEWATAFYWRVRKFNLISFDLSANLSLEYGGSAGFFGGAYSTSVTITGGDSIDQWEVKKRNGGDIGSERDLVCNADIASIRLSDASGRSLAVSVFTPEGDQTEEQEPEFTTNYLRGAITNISNVGYTFGQRADASGGVDGGGSAFDLFFRKDAEPDKIFFNLTSIDGSLGFFTGGLSSSPDGQFNVAASADTFTNMYLSPEPPTSEFPYVDEFEILPFGTFGGGLAGNVTFKIAGFADVLVPVYYQIQGGSVTPGGWSVNDTVYAANPTGSMTFEATIEASEYWPYNPNDGLGPIYDKVTGEQLRPFPS